MNFTGTRNIFILDQVQNRATRLVKRLKGFTERIKRERRVCSRQLQGRTQHLQRSWAPHPLLQRQGCPARSQGSRPGADPGPLLRPCQVTSWLFEKCIFSYLRGLQRGKKEWTNICWFNFPNSATARAGSGWRQDFHVAGWNLAVAPSPAAPRVCSRRLVQVALAARPWHGMWVCQWCLSCCAPHLPLQVVLTVRKRRRLLSAPLCQALCALLLCTSPLVHALQPLFLPHLTDKET